MDKTYICLFDLRAYDQRVAPALRQYVSKYEPGGVVKLLQEVRERLPELTSEGSRPLAGEEDYEHWIVSIAPDAGYKPSAGTVRDLCNLLLPPLCLVHGEGFDPMQEMTPVAAWLTDHSEWFADLLLQGGEELAGGRLEFSFGSGSLVATREQIRQFREEVRRVPAPDAADAAQAAAYENLVKLAAAAQADQNHTLLKTGFSSAG